MLIPAQRYSDTVLSGSTRTDATGTVNVPEPSLRRYKAISAKVTGGTATFTLKGSASGSVLGAIATSGATAASWAYMVEAPWSALELSWASNTGEVVVEAVAWE
jgi:TctA family transporter